MTIKELWKMWGHYTLQGLKFWLIRCAWLLLDFSGGPPPFFFFNHAFAHVLNTTIYSMTNTVPLIHLVRHCQLNFLVTFSEWQRKKPARRYALYIPTIGKRRPGRPHTSYLTYVQRLLGDNEGAMQEQQIAALAGDRRAWRNLVVTCSTANGWWWFAHGVACSTVSFRKFRIDPMSSVAVIVHTSPLFLVDKFIKQLHKFGYLTVSAGDHVVHQ